MKLSLSEANIKSLIDDLEYLEDSLAFASQNIVKQLVNNGYDKAYELNAMAPQSGTSKSVVTKNTGKSTRNGTAGSISLEGESALYDEFGTGEEGLMDPHPLKSKFGLNPYNSGPFVSTHINPENGKHFWFYTPMAGQPYFESTGYTEGIPSGKQMYNTLQYIRSIKNDIINKELNSATKTLR